MSNVKPKKYHLTEDAIDSAVECLPEFIKQLKQEGRDEESDAVKRVVAFLETYRHSKRRHYCYKCKAKRDEDKMLPMKPARF